jgi:hypothetical protein
LIDESQLFRLASKLQNFWIMIFDQDRAAGFVTCRTQVVSPL